MLPTAHVSISLASQAIEILATSNDPAKCGLAADLLERASASIRRTLNTQPQPKDQP